MMEILIRWISKLFPPHTMSHEEYYDYIDKGFSPRNYSLIKNMDNTKFEVIFMRFLKGFVAGGLGSVASLLAAGFAVNSFADLKTLGLTILAAFVTGGLLALQKLISWQPPQVPTPPVGSPEA